jgi:hypothetical protein
MSIPDALAAEEGDDGLVIMSYDDENATASLAQQLHKQVEPTPDTSSTDDDADPGGVIRRSNEFRSQRGPTMLESIALAGMEISKSVERRARDLYRNKFPLLVSAFEKKCEDCGAEYDEDVGECEVCEGTDLRDPDKRQRVEARHFFEEVNKEGQSLQELYQSLSKDAGRLGGWIHLVRYRYAVVNGAVMQEPIELVRADQKRLKPVVDEDGRLGGYWWTCPIHRDDPQEDPGACEECGADRREVFWAEVDDVGGSSVEKVFFEDEVIDYAAFNERLSGHDWLSPVEHLWKRQAILVWMNSYAAAFFDDKNTDRYPGRLLVLHTTNRDAVEKQLQQASDEREQDPYANGVFYNEIPRGGNSGSGGEAQVIDLMNDELMGQSPDIKDDFKSDIRSVYGQVDVQDSELEDAGGLNNEGLQLSVRDDYLASEHQLLKDGPLQKLMRVLGFDGWRIRFVPSDEPQESPAPSDAVTAAATAEQAGIPYAIEDGEFRLADTEGVVEPEPEPESDDTGETPGTDGPAAFGDDRDGIDVGVARQQVRAALEALDADAAGEGARWISQAYDGLFAEDTAERQAQPVFTDNSDVPEFAQELLGDAIAGGAVEQPEELSNAQHRQFEGILERNLVEEGNWSIDTIQQDIQSTFNAEAETARTWAINGVQNVVQPAIQLGYMIEGDLDERRFYLGGPEHESTCEACETFRDETNPDAGGEPLPLDEFQQRAREVAQAHDIDTDPKGGQLHPNCIHRTAEHREVRD